MTRLFGTLAVIGIFFITGMSQEAAWVGRKDWPDDFPRPSQTEKRLFYLQRNLNENTIVYDLNLKPNGEVNSKEPIDVYWLRYGGGQNGVRIPITWVQRKFGFGYNSKKDKNGDGFWVELVAYGKRKIHLKLNGHGRYEAFMEIKNTMCRLTNFYVYADESGWWPSVIHVDIYGKDIKTGKSVHERFLN